MVRKKGESARMCRRVGNSLMRVVESGTREPGNPKAQEFADEGRRVGNVLLGTE